MNYAKQASVVNDLIHRLASLAESDYHLSAFKLLETCVQECELTNNQKRYLMKASFNYALSVYKEMRNTTQKNQQLLCGPDTKPAEGKNYLAVKFLKQSYTLANKLSSNESREVKRASLEFMIDIFNEEEQWNNILVHTNLLSLLDDNDADEEKTHTSRKMNNFKISYLKFYCTMKMKLKDQEFSLKDLQKYKTAFKSCLDSPDLLQLTQLKQIFSVLHSSIKYNEHLRKKHENMEIIHNLYLEAFSFGEIRFCHDTESMEELYSMGVLYAMEYSSESMAYSYLWKYIELFRKYHLDKVTTHFCRVLDFCDDYANNHINVGQHRDSDDSPKLKRWLEAMVILSSMPKEHTSYYRRFLIRQIELIYDVDGYDAAQKIIAKYLSRLSIDPAVKNCCTSKSILLVLFQHQMKLSWSNGDMNTLKISLEQLNDFFRENKSLIAPNDASSQNENEVFESDVRETVLEIIKFSLIDRVGSSQDDATVKNEHVLDLKSLLHIMKQTIFTHDFVWKDEFVPKTLIRILLKIWTMLKAKEKLIVAETSNDFTDSDETDKVLMEITSVLDIWLSARKTQASSIPNVKDNVDRDNVMEQGNQWVSQVAWNLAFQTDSKYIRQALFCAAAKSLSSEMNEITNHQDNKRLSPILFSLTMELASIIQIFLETNSYSTKTEENSVPTDETLYRRAQEVISLCLKIVPRLEGKVGLRAKRVIIVYLMQGAMLLSDRLEANEIFNELLDYVKKDNSDSILPQLLSAATYKIDGENPSMKFQTIRINLLKESIEASLTDNIEPQLELLPACFDLIGESLPNLEQINPCHNQEEVIKIIRKSIEYITIAINSHRHNDCYTNEIFPNPEDDTSTKMSMDFVTILLIRLWNASINMELKVKDETNNYKVILDTAMQLKELAKKLAIVLPDGSDLKKKVLRDNTNDDMLDVYIAN